MILRAILLFYCLMSPVVAQSEAEGEFLRFLRNDGAPEAAAAWERVVTVKAAPEFWAYANGPGQKSMRNLAYGLNRAIGYLSNAMGWGDPATVLEQVKGDVNAPPYLAVLDGWKGKMAVNLNFENFVPDKGKDQIENVWTMTTTMANPAYLKPRGGKMIMNVSFDPKLTDLVGKVSKDGNTYNMVFPIYAGTLSNWKYEEVFKKGLK